ncbi:MAG: DNA polymerase III subunit delta [Planctomycetota bacterium]
MARRAATRALDGGERVVVLKGPDAFLRQHYFEQLQEMVAGRTGLDVQTVRFEGESAELGDVLDECRSLGLLPVHKLVVVDAADRFVRERTRPGLEKYAAEPEERTTLVLRAEAWRPGRLDKAVEKVGAVVDCKASTPETAARWATGRAESAHGVTLPAQAAWLLVDLVGTDLARLDGELAKLAIECGGEGSITPEAVRSLVASTREAEKPWPLQDELLTGDPARALGYVELWMGHAPRDRAVPALWACVDLTRVLATAARMAEGGTPEGVIAKHLKLWPQQKGAAVVGAARRLGAAGCARLHERACEADASAKRGTPARLALEALCIEIASAVGGRADAR